MGRICLNLLLITCLATCPFRCMAIGMLTPAAAGDAIPCECCQPISQGMPGDSRDCPDDECNCRNCLCHGVTRDIDAETSAMIVFGPAFLDPIGEFQFALRPAIVEPEYDRNSILGPFLNGRAARIAHQSLLI